MKFRNDKMDVRGSIQNISSRRSLPRFRLSAAKLSPEIIKNVEITTKFKPKEILKLHQQFLGIADRNGFLGPDGFRQSMGILGMVQDSILCQRLFSVFNESQSGLISFEEFAKGLGILVKGSVDEKLTFAFAMTDIDGSGEITPEELEITVDSIMRIYSGIMGSVSTATLDRSKIRKMFNQLDRNRDGMITLEEYKRGMKLHPEFVASLRGSDLFTIGQNNIIKEEQSKVRRFKRVTRSILRDAMDGIDILEEIALENAQQQEQQQQNRTRKTQEVRRTKSSESSSFLDIKDTNNVEDELPRPPSPACSEVTLLSDDWMDEELMKEEVKMLSQAQPPRTPDRSSLPSVSRVNSGHTDASPWRTSQGKLIPAEDRLMSILQTIRAKAQTVLDENLPRTYNNRFYSVSKPGMPNARPQSKSQGGRTSGLYVNTGFNNNTNSSRNSIPESPTSLKSDQTPGGRRMSDFVVDQDYIMETLVNSPLHGMTGNPLGWDVDDHEEDSQHKQQSDANNFITSRIPSPKHQDDMTSDTNNNNKNNNNNGNMANTGDGNRNGTPLNQGGGQYEDNNTNDLSNNADGNEDDGALGRYLSSANKGSTVFFGHKNWDLVLNVMKGIQMAVGRSAAEASRPLNVFDFSVKEKYTLIAGSKMGKHPTAGHGLKDVDSDRSGRSCRFVDYAPLVYCKLREHFGIKNEDYVHSIGPGNMLSNLMLGSLSSLAELGSEGKSGSFFYFTSDGMFMVKTVHKDEHKLLRSILPQYYYHMTREDCDSLLCRIVGCHVVRLSKNSKIGADKIYFVVMTNTLNTDLNLERRFDLKGSWVGRKLNAEARENPKATLKDIDFVELGQKIRIGPERKERLMAALRRDAKFLEDKHIIDYSLLLGIHKHGMGGSTKSFASSSESLLSSGASIGSNHAHNNSGRIFRSISSVSSVDSENEEQEEVRPIPFFQQDNGGMLSVDGNETYVMGVIDFLTFYNTKKVIERMGKTCLLYDRNGISVAPPHQYAKRFVEFLNKHID